MRRQCLGLDVGEGWPLQHPVSAVRPHQLIVFDKIAESAGSGGAILLVEQNARISLAMSNKSLRSGDEKE